MPALYKGGEQDRLLQQMEHQEAGARGLSGQRFLAISNAIGVRSGNRGGGD